MKKMFGALISSCIALVSLGCSEDESENGLMLSTGSAKLLLRANAKQSQSLPLAHFDVDVALSPLFLQFWESGHWVSVASSGSNAEFKAVIFDELGNYEGKFDLPLQVKLDESFAMDYIPPEEPMPDYPGDPVYPKTFSFDLNLSQIDAISGYIKFDAYLPAIDGGLPYSLISVEGLAMNHVHFIKDGDSVAFNASIEALNLIDLNCRYMPVIDEGGYIM